MACDVTDEALIWPAPWSALALTGAALTGLGYSLVHPGFGIEAIRRAPPESRGLTMGAYTACLDLALGIAGPALGLVAGGVGLGAVFLASALVVLCAAAVTVRFLAVPSPRPDGAVARAVHATASATHARRTDRQTEPQQQWRRAMMANVSRRDASMGVPGRKVRQVAAAAFASLAARITPSLGPVSS